jgi:hypothetical protein
MAELGIWLVLLWPVTMVLVSNTGDLGENPWFVLSWMDQTNAGTWAWSPKCIGFEATATTAQVQVLWGENYRPALCWTDLARVASKRRPLRGDAVMLETCSLYVQVSFMWFYWLYG